MKSFETISNPTKIVDATIVIFINITRFLFASDNVEITPAPIIPPKIINAPRIPGASDAHTIFEKKISTSDEIALNYPKATKLIKIIIKKFLFLNKFFIPA